MAAGQLGAYPVPINWHFTPEEAGYILADSRAKVLVIHADLLAQIASGIPVDMKVLVVPTPPEIGDAYGVPAELRRYANRWKWSPATRDGDCRERWSVLHRAAAHGLHVCAASSVDWRGVACRPSLNSRP